MLAEPGDDVARDVRRRHELDADRLGQGADRRGGELVEESGHHPVEPVGDDAVEHGDRDVHGHAVGLGPGLELVGERERELALGPGLRELRRVDLLGVGHELFEREGEQVGVAALRRLPPAVEVRGGDDVVGHALVVEVEQHVVVDDEPALARARLELLRLGEELPVVVEEPVVRRPLALHERVPHEHLARGLGVDLRVEDLAVRDDRHAVQQHLLGGDRRAALGRPVRLGVRAPREVAGEVLGPLGLDPATSRAHSRDVSTSSPAMIHAGGFLLSGEPGKIANRAPRAGVLVAGLLLRAPQRLGAGLALEVRDRRRLHLARVLHPDLGQQAGQQRLVDRVAVPGALVGLGVGGCVRGGDGVGARSCRAVALVVRPGVHERGLTLSHPTPPPPLGLHLAARRHRPRRVSAACRTCRCRGAWTSRGAGRRRPATRGCAGS